MPDNKAIVQSYIEQTWVKRNFAAIDEYMVPDYVQHTRNTPPGRYALPTCLSWPIKTSGKLRSDVFLEVSKGDYGDVGNVYPFPNPYTISLARSGCSFMTTISAFSSPLPNSALPNQKRLTHVDGGNMALFGRQMESELLLHRIRMDTKKSMSWMLIGLVRHA